WPSKYSCEKIMERLREKHFGFAYEHLNYENASHMILPFASNLNGLYKIERKKKTECRASREALSRAIARRIHDW
ncbi:MAG: hypothetical protein RR314_03410, partial [Oscillospiraceae bacterium]